MNRQLVEIASWRIVSELMRRYPRKFHVIETHPCSGQYDCLALYTPDGTHVADFNRGGRFRIVRSCLRKWDAWGLERLGHHGWRESDITTLDINLLFPAPPLWPL